MELHRPTFRHDRAAGTDDGRIHASIESYNAWRGFI